MLILLSNDDGVHSEGLKTLAKALQNIGRVVVVAPDREQSAASHSLTIQRPLRIHKIKKDIYAVDGTPADCVLLALGKILNQKPDLVVSGINKGANLGNDVHYSGTVSAAREGTIAGIPAIAASLYARKQFHFKPVADFTEKVARQVLEHGLPVGTLLNINAPNLPQEKLEGYAWTKLGQRNYSTSQLVEKIDPRGNPYYWIGGEECLFENIAHSDCNTVLENKISITPIKIEVTNHAFLKEVKTWNL